MSKPRGVEGGGKQLNTQMLFVAIHTHPSSEKCVSREGHFYTASRSSSGGSAWVPAGSTALRPPFRPAPRQTQPRRERGAFSRDAAQEKSGVSSALPCGDEDGEMTAVTPSFSSCRRHVLRSGHNERATLGRSDRSTSATRIRLYRNWQEPRAPAKHTLLAQGFQCQSGKRFSSQQHHNHTLHLGRQWSAPTSLHSCAALKDI